MRRIAWSLLLVIGGGCAWFHGQVSPPSAARSASLGWAEVETDRIVLAGQTLNFRVLIGAADGGVVLDRRLVPNTVIELKDARDCDAGERLTHIFVDFFPGEPGMNDLLELKPGEWFGQDQKFPIFIPHQDGGGIPACVDATFVFRPEAALNADVVFHVKGSLASQADAGWAADAGIERP